MLFQFFDAIGKLADKAFARNIVAIRLPVSGVGELYPPAFEKGCQIPVCLRGAHLHGVPRFRLDFKPYFPIGITLQLIDNEAGFPFYGIMPVDTAMVSVNKIYLRSRHPGRKAERESNCECFDKSFARVHHLHNLVCWVGVTGL